MGDIVKTIRDPFDYDNSSVFTLTESNVVSVTSVEVNEEDSGVTYTFDSTTGQVTVTSSLTYGDIVTITYTYYDNYSTNEVEAAIKGALAHISINKYNDWQVYADDGIYPEPEINEQNLIAVIASVILDPDNVSYKLPDISVIAPPDDPLPVKISKIIGRFKKNTGIIEIINYNE